MHVSLSSPLSNGAQFTAPSLGKSLKSHNNTHKIIPRRAANTSEQKSEDALIGFHNMLSSSSTNGERNGNQSVDEIKRAYRKMALRCHPDVCEASRRDEYTEMFVELQETYRGLLDRAQGAAKAKEKVWESQLAELSRRSQYRMRAQQHRYSCTT